MIHNDEHNKLKHSLQKEWLNGQQGGTKREKESESCKVPQWMSQRSFERGTFAGLPDWQKRWSGNPGGFLPLVPTPRVVIHNTILFKQ